MSLHIKQGIPFLYLSIYLSIYLSTNYSVLPDSMKRKKPENLDLQGFSGK